MPRPELVAAVSMQICMTRQCAQQHGSINPPVSNTSKLPQPRTALAIHNPVTTAAVLLCRAYIFCDHVEQSVLVVGVKRL